MIWLIWKWGFSSTSMMFSPSFPGVPPLFCIFLGACCLAIYTEVSWNMGAPNHSFSHWLSASLDDFPILGNLHMYIYDHIIISYIYIYLYIYMYINNIYNVYTYMYTIQVVLWATNHRDNKRRKVTRHMRSSDFSTVNSSNSCRMGLPSDVCGFINHEITPIN